MNTSEEKANKLKKIKHLSFYFIACMIKEMRIYQIQISEKIIAFLANVIFSRKTEFYSYFRKKPTRRYT